MPGLIRHVPAHLVNLLRLHENTAERTLRSGGDLTIAKQNLAFSRERLAGWIAQADAMYPEDL